MPRLQSHDPRLIEEAIALAEATDPELVYFYGWNELFEGEAFCPMVCNGFDPRHHQPFARARPAIRSSPALGDMP